MTRATPQATPRVWVLLGAHRGDNNQVLALARALGLPFDIKPMRYNFLYRLPPWLQLPVLMTIDRASRALLGGEPPDLIIAINRRTVPLVRALRRRARKRVRLVHLGNPRRSPKHFDLVITTPQYPVPDAPNVVRIPIALGPLPERVNVGETSERLLASLPRPRRLLLIGGRTKKWFFTAADISKSIDVLTERGITDGGSIIVVGSPRTSGEVIQAACTALDSAPLPTLFVPVQGPLSYAELLGAADEIHVTADSVSMVSEAIMTGKPVGLVPVRATTHGTRSIARQDAKKPGIPNHPNDLRFFWAELARRGLVGTLDRPRRGVVPDVLAECVNQILQLIEHTQGAGNERSDAREQF